MVVFGKIELRRKLLGPWKHIVVEHLLIAGSHPSGYDYVLLRGA
jgi:hypothetical protein